MNDREKAFCDASNETLNRLDALIGAINNLLGPAEVPDEIMDGLERITETHRQAHNTFVSAYATGPQTGEGGKMSRKKAQQIINRVIEDATMANASFTLPGHSWPRDSDKDTAAIREATKLWRETWIIGQLKWALEELERR